MKNFRITVNGNTYDVAVEELTGSEPHVQPTQTVAAPSKPMEAKPAPKPQGTSGGVKVTAPMPGSILDIKVSVGQAVEKGQVVAVLEAMKMENDIVSPVSGTVASIVATKGTAVDSADTIITINE